MNKSELYKLPKDILVKLLCDIQNDAIKSLNVWTVRLTKSCEHQYIAKTREEAAEYIKSGNDMKHFIRVYITNILPNRHNLFLISHKNSYSFSNRPNQGKDLYKEFVKSSLEKDFLKIADTFNELDEDEFKYGRILTRYPAITNIYTK